MTNFFSKIGEVNFAPEIEAPIIDLGECIITVNSELYGLNEVPHFHLKSVDGSYEFVICILEPKYFSHGGSYRLKLTESQKSTLTDCLQQPDEDFETIWMKLVMLWNILNPEYKITNKMIKKYTIPPNIPNYEMLETFFDYSMKGHGDSYSFQVSTVNFSNFERKEKCLTFTIRDVGPCEVYVYADEITTVPHFHLISLDPDIEAKRVNCSIEIYNCKYFDHMMSNDRLTEDQINALNNWLSKKNPKFLGNVTNWEHIANMWESLNETPDNVTRCKTQPDYTKLK